MDQQRIQWVHQVHYSSHYFFEGQSPQVQQFLDRVAAQDGTHQTAYSNLINGLVSAGIWDKIDALYVFAAAQSATALTNLKSSSYPASAATGPTFTVDRGYTGDGSSTYVEALVNPSTTVQYVRDSAHFGVWLSDVGTPVSPANGWSNSGFAIQSEVAVLDNSGNCGGAINDNGSGMFAGGQSGPAFAVANRSGASATQLYRNGSSIVSTGNASSSLAGIVFNWYILARNENGTAGSFGDGRAFAATIGGSLTSTNITDYLNLLQAYKTAVGA